VTAAAELRLAAASARGKAAAAPPRKASDGSGPAKPAAAAQPVLLPAAEFDPFQPAVGGGAALSAIQQLPPSSSSPPPAAVAAGPAPLAAIAPLPPTQTQIARIRSSAALVLSQPQAASSLEVLTRLLGNLLANPRDPKYRQVRLGNKRIAAAVADAPGGLELLVACGFAVHRDEADEDGG